jgi:hypothetical protein
MLSVSSLNDSRSAGLQRTPCPKRLDTDRSVPLTRSHNCWPASRGSPTVDVPPRSSMLQTICRRRLR